MEENQKRNTLIRSASEVGRIVACEGAAILPRYGDTGSSAAMLGTVVHAYLRDVLALGVEKAILRVPDEYREECAVINVSDLPACDPDKYEAEVAVAFDLATGRGRILGKDLDRKYPIEPTEIPGTSDVVGLTADEVLVIDYKRGWKRLPPAFEHWQLRTLALAFARTFNRSRARVALVRVKDDGDPIWIPATFESFDLDAFEAELVELDERLEAARVLYEGGKTPKLVRGPHCAYCPAFPSCPAQMAVLREVAMAAGPNAATAQMKGAPAFVPVITPENAAAVLERLEAVDVLTKHAWAALDEYARAQPIRLATGEIYGLVETTSEKIDEEKAPPVLAELYGADVAEKALQIVEKRSVTKKGLTDALRLFVARTPGAKITKVNDAALAELANRGATRIVRGASVKRFRPPAALPATTKAPEGQNGNGTNGAT